MYAVRMCPDIKIKLNLAEGKKTSWPINPAFKMIFDMGLNKPLIKRG